MNAFAHSSALPASGPQLDNRRVIAGLIDLAIVAAGALAVAFAAGIVGGDGTPVGLPVVAVMTAWALYYYFALESGGGQTLGKKVMRIRVVRLDGSPAGMGDIAVRTVLRLIDMQFAYLVGLVVMLVTGERRARLGDLAAKTMIVAADAPSIPAAPVAAGAASAPRREMVTLPSRAPEPVAEVEPVVEPAEPEPVVEVPAPVVEVAEPVDEPGRPTHAPSAPVDDEPQVVVRPVETVSAIDLVMGDDQPADGGASRS